MPDLPRFEKGQRWKDTSAKEMDEMSRRVSALENGNSVGSLQERDGTHHRRLIGPSGQLVRYKTTSVPSTSVDVRIVLAKELGSDGSTTVGDEVPVFVDSPIGINKYIFVQEVEDGTGLTYGDDDAAVTLVAIPIEETFLADLEQDGGSDGDRTTAPSYTYTVSRHSRQLATNKTPLFGRVNGSFDVASGGLVACVEGEIKLIIADERPKTTACPTPTPTPSPSPPP